MTIIINSFEEFETHTGNVLFTSSPRNISKSDIQDFCRSVDQMDWFHFDDERARASDFGGLVAPGTMTIALIHSTYFNEVELKGLRALFLGLDRFRVVAPLRAEASISLEFIVQKVEQRSEGFAVYYDFTWRNCEHEISVGTTIVRYWPD